MLKCKAPGRAGSAKPQPHAATMPWPNFFLRYVAYQFSVVVRNAVGKPIAAGTPVSLLFTLVLGAFFCCDVIAAQNSDKMRYPPPAPAGL